MGNTRAKHERVGLERVAHPLEPVFDARSEVLVLGTMPSPASREAGFYYGHPRNRFWKVLAYLFDEPVPETNEERTDLLLRHHIALWDVLACCDISGASDASIKNAQPNDLSRILNAAPIKQIFCTGAAAARLYGKLCEPSAGRPALRLPSTSPANAAASLADLKAAYAAIADAACPFTPPAVDVSRVVALEQAIAAQGTSLDALMRRAGRFLAFEVRKMLEKESCGHESHDKGAHGEGAYDKGTGRLSSSCAAHVASSATHGKGAGRLSSAADVAGAGYAARVADAIGCASDSCTAAQDSADCATDSRASVVVFCGNGNNGGDGWVAAEYLSEWGFRVCVVTAKEPDELKAEPARTAAMRAVRSLQDAAAWRDSRTRSSHAHDSCARGSCVGDSHSGISQDSSMDDPRMRGSGFHVLVNPADEELAQALRGACVVVDAVLGTGFSCSQVKSPFDNWIRAINAAREAGAAVVAADVPSGLSAQTGIAATDTVCANVTVTMIAPKPGLFAPAGVSYCGKVVVAAIAYIEPFL